MPPPLNAAATAPASCRPALPVDADAPTVDRRIAAGIRLRTWSTSEWRVAVVSMEPGAGDIVPVATGYPRSADPRTIAYRPGVAATTNGDFFDILDTGGAVPMGAVVRAGQVSFAPEGWSRGVVVAPNGRLRSTEIRVAGRLISREARLRIGAVNTTLTSPTTTVAFTPDWRGPRVGGDIAVVVRADRITRIVRDGARLRVPSDGVVVVLGSGADARGLREGARASVTLSPRARDGRAIAQASGSGGMSLSAGRLVGSCSPYESILRPRTAIGWDRAGRVWFLTATGGGPDPVDGIRRGGATKRQLAQVARALGATDVAVMDGGGSTALFTRVIGRAGAVPRRQDLPDSAWTRPVPVVWALRVATG